MLKPLKTHPGLRSTVKKPQSIPPMRFFVIVHSPTGECMPEMGRGYTYWEPARQDSPYKPRLFTSKRGAQQAARWWSNGIAYMGPVRSGSFDGCYELYEALAQKPVTGRSLDDLRVVAVEVKESDRIG